jgi:hypothetical protein
MSSSTPLQFGDGAEDFAAEVRELLAARSPDGVFWDWPGDTEVVLGRTPEPQKLKPAGYA